MKDQHTPTPWLKRLGGSKGYDITDVSEQRLAVVVNDADAAFIVRAVNNFEWLLATVTATHMQYLHVPNEPCLVCEDIIKAGGYDHEK